MYFDRNATQSAAKRRGSGGMDRRSNAAWVLPQAVKPAPRPRRVPEPSPHGRGAARGSDRLPAVDACERVGVSSRPRASAQSATPGFRGRASVSFWDVLLGCPPAPDFRNLIFETCRIGVWTTAGDLARPLVLHAPAESGAPPSRPAGGCGNPEISLSGNSEPSRAGCYQPVETHAAFGRRSMVPPKQPARRSAGDPSRLNRVGRRSIPAKRGVRPAIHPGQTAGDETRAAFAAILPAEPRCSSLRFGRNTRAQPGASPASGSRGFHHRLFTASLRAAPPSRALSAGRLAPTGRTGRSRRSRGFHHRLVPKPSPGLLTSPRGPIPRSPAGLGVPRRAPHGAPPWESRGWRRSPAGRGREERAFTTLPGSPPEVRARRSLVPAANARRTAFGVVGVRSRNPAPGGPVAVARFDLSPVARLPMPFDTTHGRRRIDGMCESLRHA